jgi:hypothetical protein
METVASVSLQAGAEEVAEGRLARLARRQMWLYWPWEEGQMGR